MPHISVLASGPVEALHQVSAMARAASQSPHELQVKSELSLAWKKQPFGPPALHSVYERPPPHMTVDPHDEFDLQPASATKSRIAHRMEAG
jgi:hypothetical protein